MAVKSSVGLHWIGQPSYLIHPTTAYTGVFLQPTPSYHYLCRPTLECSALLPSPTLSSPVYDGVQQGWLGCRRVNAKVGWLKNPVSSVEDCDRMYARVRYGRMATHSRTKAVVVKIAVCAMPRTRLARTKESRAPSSN